jgi:hypothetical protein
LAAGDLYSPASADCALWILKTAGQKMLEGSRSKCSNAASNNAPLPRAAVPRRHC